MTDPLDLDGRVALVIGGAHGIGQGIAERLLAGGARVAPGDARTPEQAEALVSEVVEQHRRLDVVVHATADAADLASSEVVNRDLLAPLFVAEAANRVMQGQDDGGVIVHVTSLSAVRPSPGVAALGAAQAGLLHLTQSLAAEWGPKVRVNAVSGDGGMTDAVADAVLFLASPLARYVSGANLVVDGGGERPAFLAAITPD